LATVLREACARARVEMEARQMSKRFRDLNAIGIRLSAERDLDTLLELILTQAREITRSDAGSLYVVERQPGAGQRLRFKLAQNDTIPVALGEAALPISADSVAGHVALSGEVQSGSMMPMSFRPRRPSGWMHPSTCGPATGR
jgi:hypothetical protein